MRLELVLLMQKLTIDDTRSERQLAFTRHWSTVSQRTALA
ncbi:hypothetical protein SynBIOSU31_02708 [Synechococcus sp. BIOS-U3-1]|nr:hypothetical protein SynBIOSU31_02708 [Synechococcus sp. BIOS-U3-1]